MEEVVLKNVSVTDVGFVVFLKSVRGPLSLPLFIGLVEAQTITSLMSGKKNKRPMSHDLFYKVFLEVGVKMEKMEVVSFVGETFYANAYFVQRDGKKVVVDARPSDCMILSLLFKCPMYVSRDIMKANAVNLDEIKEIKDSSNYVKNKAEDHESLNKSRNEELGVYLKLLEEAIEDERYEDAKKLREKIDFIIQNRNFG